MVYDKIKKENQKKFLSFAVLFFIAKGKSLGSLNTKALDFFEKVKLVLFW